MIEFPFFSMQQLNLDWVIEKIKGMLSFLPDDGTAGQILRRTADGAEWSDEETVGGAVDSVNGQTGTVVLGADDILMNDNTSVEDSVSDLKSAFVTPEMFGAMGDGVTDDTTAVNAAINAGKPIILLGKYAINDSVYLRSDTRIFGAKKSSGFHQLNSSKDIIVCDRPYHENWTGIELDLIKLSWEDIPAENTAGIRFVQSSETKDGWGVNEGRFTRIKIESPYYGVFSDSNEPIWNNTFDIVVVSAQKSAFYYNAGFGNQIRLTAIGASANSNVTRTTAFYCHGGAICSEIDIEDWDRESVIKCDGTSQLITINKMHIERCSLATNYKAFIELGNTPVSINMILLYNCTVSGNDRNYAVSAYGVSATDSCCVDINCIKVGNLTKTAYFDIILPNGTAANYINLNSACGSGWNSVYYPWPSAELKASCYYRHSAAFNS